MDNADPFYAERAENARVDVAKSIMLLVGDYWDLAYREGQEGRTTDTASGDAQRVLNEIQSLLARLVAIDNDARVQALLKAAVRAESAMTYTEATVAPGNSRNRNGEWVEVHAGRASSSDVQLRHALDLIRPAIAAIADDEA